MTPTDLKVLEWVATKCVLPLLHSTMQKSEVHALIERGLLTVRYVAEPYVTISDEGLDALRQVYEDMRTP